MSKNSIRSHDDDRSGAVHFVSQMKGGVGKSFVALSVASYLDSTAGMVQCFDTDPSNPTLTDFKALAVEHVKIVERGDLNPELFDSMMEKILMNDGPFVVDTGSSGFHAFWNYIHRNGIFTMLAEAGRTVYVHVPITAPPDFDITVEGFSKICKLVPDKSVIAWMNRIGADIQKEGDSFTDLPLVKENEDKLRCIVGNVLQMYPLHRNAVGAMLKNKWTFEQGEAGLPLMVRPRVRQVREEIYRQLEEAGL